MAERFKNALARPFGSGRPRTSATTRCFTTWPDTRATDAQAEARHRANADAAQVFQLSRERYLAGAVNYFNVFDAQRTMPGTELNGVQTLQSRFVSMIALVRAVGGGGWAAAGGTEN